MLNNYLNKLDWKSINKHTSEALFYCIYLASHKWKEYVFWKKEKKKPKTTNTYKFFEWKNKSVSQTTISIYV